MSYICFYFNIPNNVNPYLSLLIYYITSITTCWISGEKLAQSQTFHLFRWVFKFLINIYI